MAIATTAETRLKLLNFEETEQNCLLLMHNGDGGPLWRCIRSKRSRECLFYIQSKSTAADLKPNIKTILWYICRLLIFAFVDRSGPGYCMSSLIVRPKTWDSEEMAICFESARLRTKLWFVDLLSVNFVFFFFRTVFFVTVYLSTFLLHFSSY